MKYNYFELVAVNRRTKQKETIDGSYIKALCKELLNLNRRNLIQRGYRDFEIVRTTTDDAPIREAYSAKQLEVIDQHRPQSSNGDAALLEGAIA